MPEDPLVERARAEPVVARRHDLSRSLLDDLAAHAVDEDYAQAAARRAASGDGVRRRRPHLGLLVALTLFGGLVVTAALQTAEAKPQTELERTQLVSQIQSRSAGVDLLAQQTAMLRQEVARLQSRVLDNTELGQVFADRIESLGVSTGTLVATGPGVQVVVDDAQDATVDEGKVLDVDLQVLVNGLWASGAEAVSINGHRLSNLTAIRGAGQAITVNYRSLTPPYVVDAIGDPDTIPARFLDTDAGQTWLDLQANFGLAFRLDPVNELTLPAGPGAGLRFARPSAGQR